MDLGQGYRIQPITYQEYLDACARIEDRIFGDYFAFRWTDTRTPEQQARIQELGKMPKGIQVCLGLFFEGELIGWQYSEQLNAQTIVMKDTGWLADHQNKGLYSRLLPELLKLFEALGFEMVLSYHRQTNNQVILPKLKAGFFINGFRVDSYGMNVELIYAFNPDYREALHVRSGYRTPRGRMAELLGLSGV
ncbi:hypothetical protein [Deinococcus roseus]|nr:hypothetical protein [Deinococcus roseus]